MQFLPRLSRSGHKSFDSVMLLKPGDHKPVFHGELCPCQSDLLEATLSNGDSRGVPDVQDGNVYLACYLSIDLVLRVSAEQHCLGSAATQPRRCIRKDRRDFVPLILSLELLDSLIIQVINN